MSDVKLGYIGSGIVVYLNGERIGEVFKVKIYELILDAAPEYRAKNDSDWRLNKTFKTEKEAVDYLISLNTANSIDFMMKD